MLACSAEVAVDAEAAGLVCVEGAVVVFSSVLIGDCVLVFASTAEALGLVSSILSFVC